MTNIKVQRYQIVALIAAPALVIVLGLISIQRAVAVEREAGFVCPVISTDAVLNSPRGGALGETGDYTIGGPTVMVPVHATNGNGAGVPAGPHSAPGDTDYTAIWHTQQ
jgi:hypothetical protein